LRVDLAQRVRSPLDGRDEGGGAGDVEPFHVCDFFTLISSVPVDRSEGSTKFLFVKNLHLN
jgi:hypothetical protein